MSETDIETRSGWAEKRSKPVLRVALFIEGICVIIMMVLTVIHSFGRYAFDRPIPGLIEMSELLLVTAIFMAGAYTMFMKRHVAIGVVVDRFPRKVQLIITIITYSIGLLVVVLAFWQTIIRGMNIMEWGQSTIILGIPQSPFLYMVAFCWGLLGWTILMQIVDSVREVRKK